MYKLILVDDEEEVRKGILQKIEWEKIGFEVIGEAENGLEALEIAEKNIPDVVITDIKMPFLDGLGLAQELLKRYPASKVIVLTGFDEFEYAQKAIKFNVLEYVLKPISSKQLVDILFKVKTEIDEEIAKKEDMKALKEHYIESLPILREKFLTSLITNNLKQNEILQKSRYYDIDVIGKSYVVAIISVDNNTFNLRFKSTNSENNLVKDSLHLWEESELLKYAVLNICSEIVNEYDLGILFLHNKEIVIISVLKEENKNKIMNMTLSSLEKIRQTVEKFLKFTVTIGVGTFCNDITAVNISYENALSALDYRVVMGGNRVIWIEDIEPQRIGKGKIIFDDYKERELISCIKVGTNTEMNETVDKLFEGMCHSGASFKDYQIYLLEILTTIIKTAKESNVDMENILGTGYNLFWELDNLKDVLQVRDWIKEICIKIMNYIIKDRQDACKILVEKAKDYLKNFYYEKDITINKMCNYLHISPTYFSYIFKKETKMTFISYLTQVRMNAAKKLLQTTNMKSFEIAEKVGYSEPNYFSYCFKKKLGISPSQYRRGVKKDIS